MIYDAIKGNSTKLYVEPTLSLPFIYIDDLLYNTIKYLETDPSKL